MCMTVYLVLKAADKKHKKHKYTETVECSGYDLAQNNLTMEQSDHKTDCL